MIPSNSKIPFHEDAQLSESKSYLKIILTGAIILLAMIILFFILNRQSDYEKGMRYLGEKKYSLALNEFQKIEPKEREFPEAQSKINFIKGITASERGSGNEALLYLSRVSASDEYYSKAVLIIDKIKTQQKITELEELSRKVNSVRDTLILQDKSARSADEKSE